MLIGSFMVPDFTSTDWWLSIQCFIKKLQKVMFWQVTALLLIRSATTTLPLLMFTLAQSDHENVHKLKRKYGHWNVSYIEINYTTGALHVDILQNRFKVHTNGCQWLVVLSMLFCLAWCVPNIIHFLEPCKSFVEECE